MATYAYDLTCPVGGFVGTTYPYLFKNEDRRAQLVGVLEWLSGGTPLPVTLKSATDVFLMYGESQENDVDTMAVFNSSYDPIRPLECRFAKGTPETVMFLQDDGEWLSVPFDVASRWVTLGISVDSMRPCILRLSFS